MDSAILILCFKTRNAICLYPHREAFIHDMIIKCKYSRQLSLIARNSNFYTVLCFFFEGRKSNFVKF